MKNIYPQKGLSLVELMVAVTVSLFLVLGIFEIYLSNQGNYKTQKQISRLQENGRYAIHKLTESIRMGGNMGGINNRLAVKAATGVTFSAVSGECYSTGSRNWSIPMIDTSGIDHPPLLYGTNDTKAPFDSCIATDNYEGGDIISVHYADAQSFEDDGNSGTAATKVEGSDEDVFKAGTLFIRTDIKETKVFETVTCGGTAPDLHCDLESNSATASDTAINSLVKAELFYIRACNDTSSDCVTTNPDNIPTLVRVSLEPGASSPVVKHTALIEGVVSMQIQYGIDSDNDALHTIDRYENASDGDLGSFITSPRNWSRVKTVRLWLLMRSPEKELGYVDPNAPYTLGDQTVTVENGYRHMLFTTTVNLRNPGQQTL